jgi:hypothetical protein
LVGCNARKLVARVSLSEYMRMEAVEAAVVLNGARGAGVRACLLVLANAYTSDGGCGDRKQNNSQRFRNTTILLYVHVHTLTTSGLASKRQGDWELKHGATRQIKNSCQRENSCWKLSRAQDARDKKTTTTN